jgi:hypothetical protein
LLLKQVFCGGADELLQQWLSSVLQLGLIASSAAPEARTGPIVALQLVRSINVFKALKYA